MLPAQRHLKTRQSVPRNCVLGHVGKARHHAAAQGAAEDPHFTCFKPLTGIRIIVLYFTRGGDTVETASNKQSVLNDFDPKIAAGCQHGGDRGPSVCFWIVGLSAT